MTQDEIVTEGLKIAKNLEAAINNLRSEGEKIATDLIRRVEKLESQISKCNVLDGSDDEAEEEEQVEKFNVVYRNMGNLAVSDDKFSDEDDFYDTYDRDEYEFVQFVEDSGEMMGVSEN